MARKLAGSTPKDRMVVIRLDRSESARLEENRARRGQNVSTYFRTLLKEDGDVQH